MTRAAGSQSQHFLGRDQARSNRKGGRDLRMSILPFLVSGALIAAEAYGFYLVIAGAFFV
jgi:hypothetical protein